MKVADLARDVGYMGLPEPVRTLSVENKGATKSPATLADTAHADSDHPREPAPTVEKLSKMANRRLKFEYREEADIFQVTVVDEDDEVIRKIPADGVLRVIENIERMLGFSIDARA
jgi:uncharacterized FlaG/YvyC family protein